MYQALLTKIFADFHVSDKDYLPSFVCSLIYTLGLGVFVWVIGSVRLLSRPLWSKQIISLYLNLYHSDPILFYLIVYFFILVFLICDCFGFQIFRDSWVSLTSITPPLSASSNPTPVFNNLWCLNRRDPVARSTETAGGSLLWPPLFLQWNMSMRVNGA